MSDAAQIKAEGYYEALYNVQAVHFTLMELGLYLDTHPMDGAALQQYHQLSQQSQEMMRRFEDQYGPLTHSGVKATTPYSWTATPWPWEV